MTGVVLEVFGQYCLYEVTNTVCDRYCIKILFTFVATYVVRLFHAGLHYEYVL